MAAADEAPQQAEGDQPGKRVAGDDVDVAQLLRFGGDEGDRETCDQRPVEDSRRQVPDADGFGFDVHDGPHFGMVMECSS
jgi:hypothetical protein